jgi:riboflavin synthase
MFTGIIRQKGTVKKIKESAGLINLTISASGLHMKIGDSIAVDGACLTVTGLKSMQCKLKQTDFTVQAMPETLARTIIKNYRHGTIVNLESPLKLDDSLHGHLVQGHVDFTGKITASALSGDSRLLAITLPVAQAKFLALKGSMTINGVSLTVSKLHTNTFEVALIPQTIKTTNLGAVVPGTEVNVEVDLIARYLERLITPTK